MGCVDVPLSELAPALSGKLLSGPAARTEREKQ